MDLGRPSVSTMEIPAGEDGSLRVADLIYARVTAWDPGIRRVAEEVLRAYAPVYGPDDILRIFVAFLQSTTSYAQDHAEVEELRAPRAILREILERGHAFLDCDDYVQVLGALLTHMGVKVRLVLASDIPEPPHELNHVYLEAETSPGAWTPVEMLEPRPVGFEWKGFWRVKRFPEGVH